MEARELLKKIRCFVLDMDGTIYLGNTLFPFTRPFLEAASEAGRDVYFFTNNSSRNARCYVEKLSRMGIDVRPGHLLISNGVIIDYLLQNHPEKSVFVVGTPELVEDFQAAGLRLDDQAPDIVVLGFDTTLHYEKLRRACDFIRGGCLYFGVNPDLNCPVEGGAFLPDCGSIARLIEASTGRMPEFFGKPSRHTYAYLVQKTGFAPEQIAVVGDRLYTDIAVAQGTPLSSILVLSGESTREQALSGEVHPDLIVNSLEDLTPLLV